MWTKSVESEQREDSGSKTALTSSPAVRTIAASVVQSDRYPQMLAVAYTLPVSVISTPMPTRFALRSVSRSR